MRRVERYIRVFNYQLEKKKAGQKDDSAKKGEDLNKKPNLFDFDLKPKLEL